MAKATYIPPLPVAGTVTLTLTEREAAFIRQLIGGCTGECELALGIWRAISGVSEVDAVDSGIRFTGRMNLTDTVGVTDSW